MYPIVSSPSLSFFRMNNTSWAVVRVERANMWKSVGTGPGSQSVSASCCHWYLLWSSWNKAIHQWTGLGTRYTFKYYKRASSIFPSLTTFYDLERAPTLLWNDSTSAVYQPSKWIKDLEFPLFLHPQDQRVQARAGEGGGKQDGAGPKFWTGRRATVVHPRICWAAVHRPPCPAATRALEK